MIEERKNRLNTSSFSSDSSNSDNQTKPQKKVKWQISNSNSEKQVVSDSSISSNQPRKTSLKPSASQKVVADIMMPFENPVETVWSQNIYFRGTKNPV